MAGPTPHSDEVLYLHKGIPFDERFVPMNSWNAIERFQARPNDIIINTFPRSGTHWLRRIVEIIMDYPATPVVDMVIMEITMPGSAKPVYKELQQLRTDRPRVIVTHLPLTLFPKSLLETDGVKIIYCMRNFLDVVASSFEYGKKSLIMTDVLDYSKFVKFYADGKCMFGDWAEHIKLMWARREEKNTLVIKYEELKTDFEQTTRAIGDFLGRPLSSDKLRQLDEGSSLERMRADQEDGGEWVKYTKPVQKGEVSFGRGLYSDKDFALLKKYVDESLAGTGIHFPTGDDIN
ncbi:sulfotransferase 1A1-like [Asterias rubens]|uniref:sulfotransferase 1A1-like n=1 Tax=Asterias rubens TaxID=7604 RepID=UPI00145537BF|nr:sulfotransferase 1A1-like [Asterias rubens]